MPAVTLKAHYDGEWIVLDEPFEISRNSPLMVTILPVIEAMDGRGLDRGGSKRSFCGIRNGGSGVWH
jgi:hypothetical protein